MENNILVIITVIFFTILIATMLYFCYFDMKYIIFKQVIPYKPSGLHYNLNLLSLKKSKVNLYKNGLKVDLGIRGQDKFYYKDKKGENVLLITERLDFIRFNRLRNGDTIIVYLNQCNPYIIKIKSTEKDSISFLAENIYPDEKWEKYLVKENFDIIYRVIYSSKL